MKVRLTSILNKVFDFSETISFPTLEARPSRFIRLQGRDVRGHDDDGVS